MGVGIGVSMGVAVGVAIGVAIGVSIGVARYGCSFKGSSRFAGVAGAY